MASLANYFTSRRRYTRSVNLERDASSPQALTGYVLTEQATVVLRRILEAICSGNRSGVQAWTLTGAYGTGKSTLAQYLTALTAPASSQLHQSAWQIATEFDGELTALRASLSPQGLVRAIATGEREPIARTIARALLIGIETFWSAAEQPEPVKEIIDQVNDAIKEQDSRNAHRQVLNALANLPHLAKTHVLIIIDELGKNLEFAAQAPDSGDLYLLQRIAELAQREQWQVYFLGLLHQSLIGYSNRLSTTGQNEWLKVQGRFEDIPLQLLSSQALSLIEQALDRSQAEPLLAAIRQRAQQWAIALADFAVLKVEQIAGIYPLHPVSALLLPQLCTRYAQNGRSLFSFLTSDEPSGLQAFLRATAATGLPTLQPHQLYDYLVQTGLGFASPLSYQRWVEVRDLIQEAEHGDREQLVVLKTIGVLNLATSFGSWRATPELVALSLCDTPEDAPTMAHWLGVIRQLRDQGTVAYCGATNELRLWQGSDFDVETAVVEGIANDRTPLADVLAAIYPLKPLIAQRHYSQTGNLRYFERRYGDRRLDWSQVRCTLTDADGLIVYWLEAEAPNQCPAQTADGRPLLVVTTTVPDILDRNARELYILQQLNKQSPELAADGVARREVRRRLAEAETRLSDTFLAAYAAWSEGRTSCQIETIRSTKDFLALLSRVCDRTYSQGMRLDNELINRRVLTTQGAKARRMLLEAMLTAATEPHLGLKGYGPEVAMYHSLLSAPRIHRLEGERWGFFPPPATSGLAAIWQAIEAFCLEARTERRSLGELYAKLNQPPYGARPGALPVLLAAILLSRAAEIGVFKDNSFIPVLGMEHFELLVKDPARFSVKNFTLAGARQKAFQELEALLVAPGQQIPAGIRNASLLLVAKPLFGLLKRLPKYTRQTKRVSERAQAVLHELQKAQEPDELLFVSLPQACGLPPIQPSDGDNLELAQEFRFRLTECLQELQTAYDKLLADCRDQFDSAFNVRAERDELRADLQARASRLVEHCQEPALKRFLLAASDKVASDRDWLAALAMIVADKPAESWRDEDVARFKLTVSDLARRFKNLEALQTAVPAYLPGLEARRIAVTRSDGSEVSRIVWIDREQAVLANHWVDRVLASLPDGDRQRQWFLVQLNERLLADSEAGKDELRTARVALNPLSRG